MTTFPAPPLRWAVCPQPDVDQADALAAELTVPRALAALLIQRGHSTGELARRFLKPSLSDLADPLSLFDM
ncbi:MAG: single-stranded-DNA-specific exonuclease RecJ, partial [Bacillota bacterium]